MPLVFRSLFPPFSLVNLITPKARLLNEKIHITSIDVQARIVLIKTW